MQPLLCYYDFPDIITLPNGWFLWKNQPFFYIFHNTHSHSLTLIAVKNHHQCDCKHGKRGAASCDSFKSF